MSDQNGGTSKLQPFELIDPATDLASSVFVKEIEPGNTIVGHRIETPIGSLLFCYDADSADALGKGLRKAARSAKLGLTIVGDADGGDG